MAVYYKHLFTRRCDISDSEGIVYSALIYRALENPEFFDKDGDLDMRAVRGHIHDEFLTSGSECLDLPKINQSRLAKSVGMTRDAVIKILKRLQRKSFMGSDFVVCPIELIDGGYMQLPVLLENTPDEKKLTSQQRVFYGFLKDRAIPYRGIIDTWASRLSKLFGTSQQNIYYMMSVLERKGYLERLPDGRLKIK